MPKTYLLLFLGAIGALPASSATISYTNQEDFLTAAASIHNATTELETFSGPAVTAPGLGVHTNSAWIGQDPNIGYGHIADGEWSDCVGRNCAFTTIVNSSTTWTFAKPTYAFGATFIYYNRFSRPGGQIGLSFGQNNPLPLQSGFYGFVSDEPFTELIVLPDVWRDATPGLQYWQMSSAQIYTMDDLYFAEDSPAPEPATWGLLLAGLLLVLIGRALRHG